MGLLGGVFHLHQACLEPVLGNSYCRRQGGARRTLNPFTVRGSLGEQEAIRCPALAELSLPSKGQSYGKSPHPLVYIPHGVDLDPLKTRFFGGVPMMAQWLTNLTSMHEVVGLVPGLVQ